MRMLKKGNITLMIFPIGVMLLMVILMVLAVLYIQIIIQIHDVKSNLFYIVSSSVGKVDIDNLSYRDYTFDTDGIKTRIDELLKKNYLNKNSKTGILDIECEKVKVLIKDNEVAEHTVGKYKVPIICVEIKVIFNPVISFVGNEFELLLHDDIKFNLLEMT